MKVFISHSGVRSRAVAAALNEWLRRVIQVVKPFYSPEIEKGAKWSGEVDQALEGTNVGILCLTRDNLKSEWIHYEAGALSKTADALIWTFLLDVEPSEVGQPLGRYQHTVAEKEDVRKLVQTINNRLAEPLPDGVVTDAFEQYWPRLEQGLEAARGCPVQQSADVVTRHTASERDSREMFGEILELLRAQQRRTTTHDSYEEKSLIQQLDEKRKNRHLVEQIVVRWNESLDLLGRFSIVLANTPDVARVTSDVDLDTQERPIPIRVTFNPPVYPTRARIIITDAAIAVGTTAPLEWLIYS